MTATRTSEVGASFYLASSTYTQYRSWKIWKSVEATVLLFIFYFL